MANIVNLEEDDWGFYIDIEKNWTDECDACNKVYEKISIKNPKIHSVLSAIYEEPEIYEKELLNTNTCFVCSNKFCCLSRVTIIGMLTYIIFWTI
jgi:hypothetical protein